VDGRPTSAASSSTRESARVSVALCTYNGELFLPKQLRSIAEQTLAPVELVACDDGSSDGTLDMLERFAGEAPFPVRIQRNAERLGHARNFEQATGLCTGDLIAPADQDDVWLPNKLRRLAAALAGAPEAGYAFCNARLIDREDRALGGKALLDRRFTRESIAAKFASGRELDLILKREFIYGLTMMVRADLRRFTLPFAPGWPHDTSAVHVLACFGFRGVPVLEPLVLYRQHPVQVTRNIGDPQRGRYDERIRMLEDLRAALIERSAATGRPPHPEALPRIDEKVRHLRALRAAARNGVTARARILAGEVMSGRWLRYSPQPMLVDKRLDPSRLWRDRS
jgi:hypothetical protein